MRNWKWPILLLIVLMAATAVGQESTLDPIRVWADASSYKYYQDSSKSYIEIYAAIKRADFQFEDQNGSYRAGCLIYVEALDAETNVVVDSVSAVLPLTVQYLEDAYDTTYRQFEVLPMLLAPATYRMKVTAADLITKRTGVATFGLAVKDYTSDKLQLSDLEFAYDIRPLKDKSAVSSLIKAGRIVQPNPNRYISNDDSVLYIYAEVYNLNPPAAANEQLELNYSLHDRFGYEIREYPTQTIEKPGASAVITKGIPVYGIPGGSYELRLSIKDKSSGEEAKTSKTFYMIYTFDQLAPTMTSEDAFSQEDAELMEKVIRYISSKEEKDTYDRLDLEGKRLFLAQFWARNNPNPGSNVNLYKNDIFRRFAYANQNFSTSLLDKTDGWKSDRGRIYITYGNPDDIVRRPSQMGEKPLEIWHYFSLPGQRGNDYCIFVDRDGYGDYDLVSSSLIGEINDSRWDSALTEF